MAGAIMQAIDFNVGEKVSMQTNLRILRGFVEQVEADWLRVRWEDDTIGVLTFDWQISRLEHGWRGERP